jgi:hypothetical protein
LWPYPVFGEEHSLFQGFSLAFLLQHKEEPGKGQIKSSFEFLSFYIKVGRRNSSTEEKAHKVLILKKDHPKAEEVPSLRSLRWFRLKCNEDGPEDFRNILSSYPDYTGKRCFSSSNKIFHSF